MAISQATQSLVDGNVGIAITVPFIAPPPPDSQCATTSPNSLNLAATQSATGGTLAGGHNYYYSFVALDGSNLISTESPLIEVIVPAGTNTNQVSFSGITPFDSAAAKYQVYRGQDDPSSRQLISGPTAIPAGVSFTFTDTGLSVSNVLPPDPFLYKVAVYWRITGTTLWSFGAETIDRSQTSLTFVVPLTIGGQSIDVQLRSVASDGSDTPDLVALTTTYAVTSPSPLINFGAHATYYPLSNPLTAHDAGSNATAILAAFTMRVAGHDISVNGGSVTGLSYNTLYYIYYDDAAYAGGAVTYQDSTTKTDALNGASRFYVGSIVTPVAGTPDTTGNNDGGSGAHSGQTFYMPFTKITSAVIGNGSVTNLTNINDGDLTTFATLTVTGNGSDNQATITCSLPSAILGRYSKLRLRILADVPTNSLVGGLGSPNNPVTVAQGFPGAIAASGLDSIHQSTTAALGYYYADFLPNWVPNVSQMTASIGINCGIGTGHQSTSGTLTMRIRDVQVVGVE